MTKQIPYKFWLVFDEKGGTPKSTKNQPATNNRERSMQVSVSLPEAIFKVPQLSASITMKDAGKTGLHLDIPAMENALSGVVDGNVVITLIEPQPKS